MTDLDATTNRIAGSTARVAPAMAHPGGARCHANRGASFRGHVVNVPAKPIAGWYIATPDAIHRWPPEMPL